MFGSNKSFLKKSGIGILTLLGIQSIGFAEFPMAVLPHNDDLQVSELSSTFINFEIAREGTDPARITLYGVVFDDCLNYFAFSNSLTDPSTLGQGKESNGTKIMGFRIQDVDGRGRACMNAHKANNDICGKSPELKCSYLDKISANNLVINQKADVHVKFGTVIPNHNSRNPIEWNDFDEQHFARSAEDAFYQGIDSVIRQKALATASERERVKKSQESKLDIYFKQAKECRKTHDDRLSALSALEILGDSGAMELDEIDKIRKEIIKAELKDLSNKFNKSKLDDSSDLDEAADSLKGFAEEHPESADAIATLFHNKAASLIKSKRSPEAYDRAHDLITGAQDISGLSEKSEKILKSDHVGIRVGKLQAEARSSQTDPYEFWDKYSSTMEDLSFQAQDCYTGALDASCAGTIQAFQAATKVPQIAQQAAYERYMLQMQFQQQMYGALGQSGGFGMGMGMGMGNTMGGALGGFAGGSPFFQ